MKNLFLAMAALVLFACTPPAKEESTEPMEPAPLEVGDTKFVDVAKSGLQAFNSKNVDGFVSGFADNAIYRFNNGDSLAGKQAIADYWNERFTNVIQTISIENDVWVPLKVNQSPANVVTQGDWVLGWFMVTATYKTGKSMTQWIHTDYHFDNNGKIDQVIQYIDRASIMAAMTPDK